jgi:hypothetical protein
MLSQQLRLQGQMQQFTAMGCQPVPMFYGLQWRLSGSILMFTP